MTDRHHTSTIKWQHFQIGSFWVVFQLMVLQFLVYTISRSDFLGIYPVCLRERRGLVSANVYSPEQPEGSNSNSDWKQDRQCAYNVTMCSGRTTIVAVGTQQCILCVVELHVTVSYIKILSVAQQCFYGKFISRPKYNVRISSCKVPDAASLMTFFRRIIWLNRP